MTLPTTLTPSLAIHLAVSAKASVKVRSNFAAQHLQAAEYFSKKSGKLEAAAKSTPSGELIDDTNHLVTAAIFLSVASMEANINQYFFDNTSLAQPFNQKDRRIKKDKSSIIRKYQSAMLVLTRKTIDKNSLYYRDGGFRNEAQRVRQSGSGRPCQAP